MKGVRKRMLLRFVFFIVLAVLNIKKVGALIAIFTESLSLWNAFFFLVLQKRTC
jgi:hypothetical protein